MTIHGLIPIEEERIHIDVCVKGKKEHISQERAPSHLTCATGRKSERLWHNNNRSKPLCSRNNRFQFRRIEIVDEASEQMDRSSDASHTEEALSDLLVSLREKLETIPSIFSDCCIFRVPKRLRKRNDQAYTPRVVSIGPLHHGNDELRAMEKQKLRYLKDFVLRTKVSLEDYLNLLKEKEARLRNSYEEPIELTSNVFLEMILVDAAFIIEVILRYQFPDLRNGHDFIFSQRWLMVDVRCDMLLIENQIPFFILEDLFLKARITIPPEHDERLSLLRLIHRAFKTKAYFAGIEQLVGKLSCSKIEHFVHFVRICHQPQDLPPQGNLKTMSIPSATELHQAGVKFKVRSSTENLYGIRFKNGVLEIPHLRIRGSTESIFRNLVTFEQCRFQLQDNYVSDYFFVLDRLIDTPRDVELLVGSGIIQSKLPDSLGIVTFIDNIIPGTDVRSDHFYFADVCDDLNAYCIVPWHKWKAAFKRDYFSTPWAVLSIIAAAVLLILTFIQTLCSVISL